MLKSILNYLLSYKEITTLVLSTIVGIIPTVFEIKKEISGKKRLNTVGYVFVFFVVALFSFTFYSFLYEKRKITKDDISIILKIHIKDYLEKDSKVLKQFPKEVFIPQIWFGSAQTSGTFKIRNFESGQGRGAASKFVVYVCDNVLVDNIEKFPKEIDNIEDIDVSFKFPLESIKKENYYWPAFALIKIRDRELWGEFEESGSINFESELHY